MIWFLTWLVGFYVACAIMGSWDDEPDAWSLHQWAALLLWPVLLFFVSGMIVGIFGGNFRKWRER